MMQCWGTGGMGGGEGGPQKLKQSTLKADGCVASLETILTSFRTGRTFRKLDLR